MVKETPHKTSFASVLKGIFKWVTLVAGGVQPLLELLKENLDDQIDKYALLIERRLLWLILCGSAIFISVSAVGFGFLFILIDNCAIPRGIACLGCGLFTILLLAFSLRSRPRKETL